MYDPTPAPRAGSSCCGGSTTGSGPRGLEGPHLGRVSEAQPGCPPLGRRWGGRAAKGHGRQGGRG